MALPREAGSAFHSFYPTLLSYLVLSSVVYAQLLLVSILSFMALGQDKEGAGPGRRKVRSPSFPFIGLGAALDRARQLYDRAQSSEVPAEEVLHCWSYSVKSSGGNQTLAALRAFGLLEGEGRVKLSQRALRILIGEGGLSSDKARLLEEAARLPPLHAMLWEKYGRQLPVQEELKAYLLLEEGFNKNTVDKFIQEYRGTLEFAGMLEPARAPKERMPEPSFPAAAPEPQPFRTASLEASFPLLGDNVVELRIRHKISSEEADDVRRLFDLWLSKIMDR